MRSILGYIIIQTKSIDIGKKKEKNNIFVKQCQKFMAYSQKAINYKLQTKP